MSYVPISAAARHRAIGKALMTKSLTAKLRELVRRKDIDDYRQLAQQVCRMPLDGPVGDALVQLERREHGTRR
jgi:hypothetical protein